MIFFRAYFSSLFFRLFSLSYSILGCYLFIVVLCFGCDDNESKSNSSMVPNVPSFSCQETEVCDGVDNDCDGTIDEQSAQVGDSCECGGQQSCLGGELVCTGGTPINVCGGCTPLAQQLNTECGECGGGVWTCSPEQTLVCTTPTPRNACGGCTPFDYNLETECGQCGKWACNGTENLVCVEGPTNLCGGCNPLEQVLGDSCGQCGKWECDEQGGLSCIEQDPEVCLVTRFIAMGDTGEANDAQYRVSESAQRRCDEAGGCSGFIMLGDNIYDTGPTSPMDVQLTNKIDLPYANLRIGPPPTSGEVDARARMPIYVSLGNHDLGGAGINSIQVQHYLSYARNRNWFFYPAEFWEYKVANVHLISLHTNPLAYGIPDDQYEPHSELVNRVISQSTARWKIAFGHHPYRSNGKHGNAGAYEGLPIEDELFGSGFRDWVEANLCNQIDFYLSGHDHNRQWLAQTPLIPSYPDGMGIEECNTHFAVSGAGAKTTNLEGRGNNTLFEDDTKEGFLFMEFHYDFVYVEFCDLDGNVDWSHTVFRNRD